MGNSNPPVVLVLAGNDPVGGAGIAADIETLTANHCYAAPVITALTVQDTMGVSRVEAVDTDLVEGQARTVLNDLPVTAIKTGLLPNHEILSVVARLVDEFKLPLIVDPVLKSGSDQALTGESLPGAYMNELLPGALLATPNTLEAVALAPSGSMDEQAAEILASGCQWLLVTGGHEPGNTITHRLYGKEGLVRRFEQVRLPGEYHGSGCTLASACASGIANGQSPEAAIKSALEYTYKTLAAAFALGKGQHLPNRL